MSAYSETDYLYSMLFRTNIFYYCLLVRMSQMALQFQSTNNTQIDFQSENKGLSWVTISFGVAFYAAARKELRNLSDEQFHDEMRRNYNKWFQRFKQQSSGNHFFADLPSETAPQDYASHEVRPHTHRYNPMNEIASNRQTTYQVIQNHASPTARQPTNRMVGNHLQQNQSQRQLIPTELTSSIRARVQHQDQSHNIVNVPQTNPTKKLPPFLFSYSNLNYKVETSSFEQQFAQSFSSVEQPNRTRTIQRTEVQVPLSPKKKMSLVTKKRFKTQYRQE